MIEIRYFEPLERAYHRMVEQLFRPFDLMKWIVLGFSCWLARLAHGGGGTSFQIPTPGGWDSGDSEAAVLEPLASDPSPTFPSAFGLPEVGLVGCIVLLVLVLLAVAAAVAWVSARGQFLFIDNAVSGRARIVAPWKDFRREGNSLFLWELGWLAVALVTLLLALTPAIAAGVAGAFDEGGAGAVIAGVLSGVLFLGWLVVALYVSFFLTGFVVPIMHRERLKTTEAWKVFLPVFKQRPGTFILAGLFFLVVHLVVGIAIVLACLVTCCTLLIVLILPFVGTVALLPVYLTYRLYTLEFLAQFSPRFDFFDAAPEEPESDTVEIPELVRGKAEAPEPAAEGPPLAPPDPSHDDEE